MSVFEHWEFVDHGLMSRRDIECQRLSYPGNREALPLKIISVNVSLPRGLAWNNRILLTGIFKKPVEARVRVRTMNLDGDQQADLSVHGGRDKAVYAYPAEHYAFWRDAYPSLEMTWGMMGENLTTSGLLEHDVNIGDRFRFGSAVLMVTEPRLPCHKLAAKFGSSDVSKRMLSAFRTGFYLSVVDEGYVRSGDAIEVVERDKNNLKVSDVVRLHTSQKANRLLMYRAIETEALPQAWKDRFSERLVQLEKNSPNSD